MEELYRELGDKVEFIGINQGFKENIKDYMKKYNLSFPVAYDEGEKILLSFDARVPTHILIDIEGRIKYKEPEPPENIKKYLKDYFE